MKLSHRLLLLVSAISLTFLIICVFENSYEVSRAQEGSSGEHFLHGQVIFHRRFLNREISAEQNNVIPIPYKKNVSSTLNNTSITSTAEPRDEYEDLFKYSTLSPNYRQYMEWPPYYFVPRKNPTLGDLLNVQIQPNMTNWEKFHLQISSQALYPEDSEVVKGVLHDMATQKIIAAEQLPGGTQLKLLLTLEDGGKVLFKPMRFPREVETLPNHFYFTDFERHVSEIASFHLDRILGFRHAAPCVGRKVNITKEIYPLVDGKLLKTFFISPAGNVCFHGECSYYCDTGHAICGNPHMLEGSLSIWLPPKTVLGRKPVRSPWRRSYNKRRKAAWELDDYYCVNQVKPNPPYNYGRRLYDLMDLAIFDFLTGNMDRHHYDEVPTFGNHSSLIHLDNGRGFGRMQYDELSIITPFLQCCVLRLSTFNRLYSFHRGPQHLSDLMRNSLANDPVAPVLIEPHLKAMDRRVAKILDVLRRCLLVNTPDLVFWDDMDGNV